MYRNLSQLDTLTYINNQLQKYIINKQVNGLSQNYINKKMMWPTIEYQEDIINISRPRAIRE